jgi:hypothetical protein
VQTIFDASDQIDALQGQWDALDSLQDFDDQNYSADYLDIGGMEDCGADDRLYGMSIISSVQISRLHAKSPFRYLDARTSRGSLWPVAGRY